MLTYKSFTILQLFRRGLPNLAREIQYCPLDDEDSKSAKTDVADGEGARRILQVPSLTSTAGTAETHHTTREDSESSPAHLRKTMTMPVGHSPIQTWPGMQYAGIPYRSDEMEAWQYHYSVPPPAQYRPPYSPVRIRSGRGAARLAASRKTLSPPTTTLHRFPVSNRGSKAGSRRCVRSPTKGEVTSTKVATTCEVDTTTVETSSKGDTTTANVEVAPSKAESTGDKKTEESPSLEKKPLRSVLKRKLPLTCYEEKKEEDPKTEEITIVNV